MMRPRAPTQGKPTSPNYRVDMMHHQLAAINKEKRAGYQSNHAPQHAPYHAPQAHSKSFAGNPQQRQQSKKGYRNLSFDVKEELYRAFMGKIKGSSKSPKEVINQLISFYNMGKINL